MAFIEIIEPEAADEQLKGIYNNLLESRGQLAEIHKIHSLNPQSMVDHMDLYMTLMYGKSPLKRWQRELLGVITSQGNHCKYCLTHHSEALNHYWKDEDRIKRLIVDYNDAELKNKDMLLCKYAEALTSSPSDSSEKIIIALKESGFSDRAILDATMIIAYFNFVNRIVLGLGLNLEKDRLDYKY